MNNDDIVEPTDCAVVLDVSARSGTSNVLAQRQATRAMYAGQFLCTCQLNLKAGEKVSYTTNEQLLCIMTNVPLIVAFTAKDGSYVQLNVNQIMILDDHISELVISNQSEETAVVSVTKLC